MAFDGDPYRILGLARDASLDEVKRAYRRLAKTHHPDAAGSGALARFLAIQAAYEELVEGSGRAARGPRGPSKTARRASEADPSRADATRRAYGGRPRARRPSDAQPGGAGADGGGAEGEPSGQPRTEGPAGSGPTDPQSARRRGKATLGSTSYDDATAGPFEPDWSGASWYGTTSGTYWTINPKEYADPRKHGPEYQARARRAAGARHDASAEVRPAEPVGADDAGQPAATAEPKATAEQAATAPPSGVGDPGRPPGPRQTTPRPTTASWWDPTAESPEPVARSDGGPAGWGPIGDPSRAADDPVPDPARALANLARALTDPRAGGVRGRVMRGFVGWLPLALGIGWLLGEITGCGRFAASCDPSVNPLILLVQGAALVALLLLPLLASLAASAALVLTVAAVAAALILSASGTAADEGSRRATLGLLLVVAWLAGLALAIVQRVRAASSRVGPVS